MNVATHTNTVHAGRTTKRGGMLPACMSMNRAMSMHYAIPTEAPVTCTRCINAAAKVAAR